LLRKGTKKSSPLNEPEKMSEAIASETWEGLGPSEGLMRNCALGGETLEEAMALEGLSEKRKKSRKHFSGFPGGI